MNTVLFFKFFAGLMAIMNPLISLPVFIALTKRKTFIQKKNIAIVASISICVILFISAYSGQAILKFFGLTVPIFGIAGGIVVGMIALSMLNAEDTDKVGPSDESASPAIVPIALPLIAGPGAISKTIAFAANATGHGDLTAIMAAIASGAFLVLIVLLAADIIYKILGKTGITTITKIMALLLGAIAVEMIVNGIKGSF